MKQNKKRIIQVPVPKEIWNAHMSIWNVFADRDIVGAWMRSVQDTINQMNKK